MPGRLLTEFTTPPGGDRAVEDGRRPFQDLHALETEHIELRARPLSAARGTQAVEIDIVGEPAGVVAADLEGISATVDALEVGLHPGSVGDRVGDPLHAAGIEFRAGDDGERLRRVQEPSGDARAGSAVGGDFLADNLQRFERYNPFGHIGLLAECRKRQEACQADLYEKTQ